MENRNVLVNDEVGQGNGSAQRLGEEHRLREGVVLVVRAEGREEGQVSLKVDTVLLSEPCGPRMICSVIFYDPVRRDQEMGEERGKGKGEGLSSFVVGMLDRRRRSNDVDLVV